MITFLDGQTNLAIISYLYELGVYLVIDIVARVLGCLQSFGAGSDLAHMNQSLSCVARRRVLDPHEESKVFDPDDSALINLSEIQSLRFGCRTTSGTGRLIKKSLPLRIDSELIS